MAAADNSKPLFDVINYDPSKHSWADMSKQEVKFATLRYNHNDKTLEVLDQLLLPAQTKYIQVKSVSDAFDVIKRMNVRGAPLIATVALLGLSVDLEHNFTEAEDLIEYTEKACDYLKQSRPTAINLSNEILSLKEFIKPLPSTDDTRKKIQDRSYQLYLAEREENDLLLRNSTVCVEHTVPEEVKGKRLKVITICNTGALATSSFGTALGVIKALHDRAHLDVAFCLETRPYLQGSRLTAYELQSQNIPHRLICDSMAASLMKTQQIHAVLVGADQVARNGDTANKIGTYMLAVLAQYHKIPFYVVAPTSSINGRIASGEGIVIEERPANELKVINNVCMSPIETPVWNPAFDVTPASLITAVLTEKGNARPEGVADLLLLP